MIRQLNLFSDTALVCWPCTGPGTLTVCDSEDGFNQYWRSRKPPRLSEWIEADSMEDSPRNIRYWSHPGGREENELARTIAISINPEGFYWTIRFFKLVGSDQRWTWSRGKSESMPEAMAVTLSILSKMCRFPISEEGLRADGIGSAE